MPNTLINKLTSSRKDLEEHQEKLFNNKLFIKRAKFANFQVLYLPDLCKNLPWNIVTKIRLFCYKMQRNDKF